MKQEIENYIGKDIYFGLLVALTLSLLSLSGCALFESKDEKAAAKIPTVADVQKGGLIDGAVKSANTPLFEMTCAPSCTFASLKVGNPGATEKLAEVVRVVMTPQPSEASQNFRAVLSAVTQVGGGAVIGHYGSKITESIVGGFKSGFTSNSAIAAEGFGATVKVADNIPQPGPISTVNNSLTVSGAGAAGAMGGSASASNPVTSTSNVNSNNPISNSYNPVNPAPRVCTLTPTYTTAGQPSGFREMCTSG